MSRWAVVVGINAYDLPGASLQGAVSDAARTCRWLLDPAGGNVPPPQLLLGLHPTAATPTVDADCAQAFAQLRPLPCANKDQIVDLFHRVVQKSGGEGERLYVYYSGHGLQYEPTPGRFESAIVAPDCDALHPDRSITVTSILEYFEATGFLDQFFIFDACRNVPWKGRFEAGRISVGPPCDPPAAAPQQFVCLATSKGSIAAELRATGQEGGAFTEALLRGLAGDGTAKSFDLAAGRFVVRWNRLFEFVCRDVQSRRQTLPDGEQLVQVPRDEGSKRGANRTADPELWSVDVATASFPPVELKLRIEPGTAAAACSLVVDDLSDPLGRSELEPPATGTVSLQLPPRLYRVLPSSRSPSLRPTKPKGEVVELMSPGEVELRFEPQVPGAVAPGAGSGVAKSGVSGRPATLAVDPGDALIPWELLDASGGVVAARTGPAEIQTPPGVYRVRAALPESEPVESIVDLDAGELERLQLALPAPGEAVTRLATQVPFPSDRGRLQLSEALGWIAGVELSTTLALAATVAAAPGDPGFGHKLRAVGLLPVDQLLGADSDSGLVVTVGTEASESGLPGGASAIDELRAVRIGCWPVGAVPGQPRDALLLRGSAPAIAQWAAAGARGHVWLGIAAPDRAPVVFAVYVPKDRILSLVLQRRSNGDVCVYQFTPRRSDELAAALRHTRRLELAQRYMLRGRYDYPADPGQLLEDLADDPMAMLLAGYLWQRQGHHDLARRSAERLLERYPDWSDPHLICAEAAVASRDENTARVEYAAALRAGLPVFAGGFARLWQAATRRGLQHASPWCSSDVVGRRVPGLLWTALASISAASARRGDGTLGPGGR